MHSSLSRWRGLSLCCARGATPVPGSGPGTAFAGFGPCLKTVPLQLSAANFMSIFFKFDSYSRLSGERQRPICH
jgi:hypothetical protein